MGMKPRPIHYMAETSARRITYLGRELSSIFDGSQSKLDNTRYRLYYYPTRFDTDIVRFDTDIVQHPWFFIIDRDSGNIEFAVNDNGSS